MADLNQDGQFDLVVTNYAGDDVSILWGNGDGSFQPSESYRAGPNPFNAAVADFNSDGLPDLAVANYGDASVSILLAEPDASRGARPPLTAGRGPADTSPGFTRLNPADWPLGRPEIGTRPEPAPDAPDQAGRSASRPEPGGLAIGNPPTPAVSLPAGPLARANRAGQPALPDLDDGPAIGGIELGA